MFPRRSGPGLLPGSEIKVMGPKELDLVAVIDAQRVGRIVVVDSIPVVQETTVGSLLLTNIVLRERVRKMRISMIYFDGQKHPIHCP